MTQFKASLSKEIKFFTRSRKLLAIILVLLGLSLLDPAIIKSLDVMTATLGTALDDSQDENPTAVDMEKIVEENIGDTSDASAGVVAFVGDVSSTGLLVTILLLMGVAGKEQKRRATIIPACSGLRTGNYLLPKFLLYPAAVFLTAIAATFSCAFISASIFETSALTAKGIFASGVFLGIYLAFCVCAHLFIGLSTSRPGLSAGVLITLSYLLPLILSAEPLDLADKYNPIALRYFAAYALGSDINSTGSAYNSSNVGGSVFITIILIVLMYLLTLFILNAKKIDNSGNETLL